MLITIDGIDGSGKNTQAKLLQKNLQDIYDEFRIEGKVSLMSFPDYGNNLFANEVGNYLNGNYGSLNEVHPKFASMMYAGDRFINKNKVVELSSGKNILICDRYVESNLAFQTAKYSTTEEQLEMRNWLIDLEYNVYKMPVPDVFIYLSISAEVSRKLVALKEGRLYTEKKHDLHEDNTDFLSDVVSQYNQLMYGHEIIDTRINIPCLTPVSDEMRSIEDISIDVLRKVKETSFQPYQ